MAGKGVEQLYKNYGILADAGESISGVSESIRCFDQYGHVCAIYNLCLHVFLFNAPHMWPPIFCASCFHTAQRSV